MSNPVLPCGPGGPCDIFSLKEKIDLVLLKLKQLEAAFPHDETGDVDWIGHRRYHDAKITAAKAEAEFWTALKLDIAKRGAWAIITILAGFVLFGLVMKFRFLLSQRVFTY